MDACCRWTGSRDSLECKGLLEVDVCGEVGSESEEEHAEVDRLGLPACLYDGGEILWTSHAAT